MRNLLDYLRISIMMLRRYCSTPKLPWIVVTVGSVLNFGVTRKSGVFGNQVP
jgi:hypothetical protein